MRRIIRTITLATLFAALCAACHREKTGFGDETGGTGSYTDSEMGYIALPEGGIIVEWFGENVNTPTGSDQFPDIEETRAAATPDIDKFMITVSRLYPEPAAVVEKRFGEFVKDGVCPLPITRGGVRCEYRVTVSSGTMANTAWEGDEGQPTYSGASASFSVGRTDTYDNPKRLEQIRCSLESIKVSVFLERTMAELSSDVKLTAKIFDPAEKVESSPYALSFDNGEHHFGVVELDEDDHHFLETRRESSFGYFKPVTATGDAITLHVEMKYGASAATKTSIVQDIPICSKSSANLASANQSRRIMLYITHGQEDDLGKLIINAAVESWTYDEEVEVDVISRALVSAGFSEDAIPDIDDPLAPRITTTNFYLDDVNWLDRSSYYRGEYAGTASVDIETASAISRFAVRLGTDNAVLAERFDGIGVLDTSIDMMNTDAETDYQRTFINTLGFPRQPAIEGQTSLTVDLKPYLNYLFNFSGNHTLSIGITDSEGRYSRVDLKISYDKDKGDEADPTLGPEIVWPGRDMDKRHEIVEGMQMAVNVTANAGIRNFVVEIIGLELDGTGLPSVFDLIDPDDYTLVDYDPNDLDSYKDLHKALGKEGRDGEGGLGFPVRDEVKDKTKVTFDGSAFTSLLKALGTGLYEFRLTVTDNNGLSITRSIKLEVK